MSIWRMLVLGGVCLLGGLCLRAGAEAVTEVRMQFDQRYAAWDTWCGAQTTKTLAAGPEFNSLVTLGPPAAAYFVEKMGKATPRQAAALAEGLARITKKRFPAAVVSADTPEQLVQAYQQWWTEGRKGTRAAFDACYARWKDAKAKSNLMMSVESTTITFDDVTKTIVKKPTHEVTDLQRAYDELTDMGIDILPLIIDKFHANDADLLPLFADLTHTGAKGKNAAERAQNQCRWWELHKDAWLLAGNTN